MHDPCTLAFEIKAPWRRAWPTGAKGYRPTLVNVWHVDPEDHRGKLGCRSDDSCGWFTPSYSPADHERIEKAAKQQYSQIFEQQARIAEGSKYAYVCNVPDCHSAVYWSWRAIKHLFKPSSGWQWGADLTASELEAIYSLATCPNDNLQVRFNAVKNTETFEEFFFLVYAAYRRHHRSWWRHPRFHFWHWRVTIIPIRTFKRWAFSRCGVCGGRFAWGESPVSGSWGGEGPRWFRGEPHVCHMACHGATMVPPRRSA